MTHEAPRQGRLVETEDHTLSSVAEPRDDAQAAAAVTLELVDGLVLLVTADGCRRILARITDLEPFIDAWSGS